MAKKEKMVDLKPKAEKVSDEQLKQLQKIISTSNKLQFDIGTLEAQKHSMLHAMFQANEKIRTLQDEFQKEYGTYDINIQDGTINYKDEQTDKKD
tara:strand:+ start:446 stop:730 length:285 start_codon:yes stop_codon:yes gene_type:complete